MGLSASKPRQKKRKGDAGSLESKAAPYGETGAPSGTEMDPYGPGGTRPAGARTRVAWQGKEAGAYGATQPAKSQPPAKASRTWTLAWLIFAPFLAFTLVICLFGLAYFHAYTLVWASVVVLSMLAILKILHDLKRGAQKPEIFLGVLVLVACLAGTVLGVWLYNSQLAPYWAVELGRVYTNLLPDQPAEAHADVGIINFAEGARVDTAQSASFTAGYKYCVAPVVGATLKDPDIQAVQYWAVGLDCCTPRSGFMCDDALSYDARSGVALIDASSLLTAEKPYYQKAVDQATATYGIITAVQPVFLSWVEDPFEVQADRWKAAMWWMVWAIAGYLLASTLFAGALQMGSPLKASEVLEPDVASGKAVPGKVV